jgi:hypothetical protein
MNAREMATAWGDWATTMADAFDSFVETMVPVMAPSERDSHRHWSGRKSRIEWCGACRTDRCHCECCIYDADLVVYARLGEQRVVPVRISNERTRERDIQLELSDFTMSGGKPVPVHGEIQGKKNFKLAACERKDAALFVVTGANDLFEAPSALDKPSNKGDLKDVDDCVVAYADLRILGCDIRPVRIAVALLPRDCDPYEVHCACGCC